MTTFPKTSGANFRRPGGLKFLKYAEQKKGWSSYLDEMKAALTEDGINPTGK